MSKMNTEKLSWKVYPRPRLGARSRLLGGAILALLTLTVATAVTADVGALAVEPSNETSSSEPFEFSLSGSMSVVSPFANSSDNGYYSLAEIPLDGVEIEGVWDPFASRILSAELTFANFTTDVLGGEFSSPPTLQTQVNVFGGESNLFVSTSGTSFGDEGLADLQLLALPEPSSLSTACALTFESLSFYVTSLSLTERGILGDLSVSLFNGEPWGELDQPLAPRFEPSTEPDCMSLNDAFGIGESTEYFYLSLSSNETGGGEGAPLPPHLWSAVPDIGSVTVTVAPSLSGPTTNSMLVTATRIKDGSTAGTCVPNPVLYNELPDLPVYEYSCRIDQLLETETYIFTATAANELGASSSLPSQKVTPGRGSATPQFIDIPPDTYFTRPTSMLKLRDITTGVTPTQYAPAQNVTREQMVVFMHRLQDKPPTSLTAPCGFADYDAISDWARNAACWAKENGITTPATFNPKGNVTRDQMAAFLHRLVGAPQYSPSSCELLSFFGEGLVDLGSIPDWAREGACWLKLNGITTENPYKPSGVVTRAQMAAFLYRTGAYMNLWVS